MSNAVAIRWIIPFNKYVQVLKHERSLLALDKPCGILSHPNALSTGPAKHGRDISIINGFYCDKNENFQFKCIDGGKETNKNIWLLNRLDSATSGVIMVSETEKVGKVVKKMFKNRQINKQYFALVFGDVAKSSLSNKETKEANSGFIDLKQSVHQSILWENDMNVTKNGSHVRATTAKSHNNKNLSRIATTSVQLVEYHPGSDTTLLKLSPHTGFTHQLRFQCAANGFPIVGDKVYGDFARNKSFADRVKGLPLNDFTVNGTPTVCVNRDDNSENSDVKSNNNPKLKSVTITNNTNNNTYRRLFLHSHRIEFSYLCPDPSSKGEVCLFEAESPVPSEFYVGRIVV